MFIEYSEEYTYSYFWVLDFLQTKSLFYNKDGKNKIQIHEKNKVLAARSSKPSGIFK